MASSVNRRKVIREAYQKIYAAADLGQEVVLSVEEAESLVWLWRGEAYRVAREQRKSFSADG